MDNLQSIKSDSQNNQDLKSLLEQQPKPSLDDTVIIGLLAFLIQESQKEESNGQTD